MVCIHPDDNDIRDSCKSPLEIRRVTVDDGRMKFLILLFPSLISVAFANPVLREGDIVFTGSERGQGEAIIAATGSQYTHCGIVFQQDGKWMVLEAVQPVSVASLEDFKSRSQPESFLVRRLKTPLAPADYYF
jgi:2-keto-4-pentenoate hydratase/2-oxohepta-3-ene-1,7-dioic acid hydratase in catechol pathway